MHRFSTLNDTELDTVLRLQAQQQQQTWRTLPEEGIDVEFEGETLKVLPNVFPPRGDTKLVADAFGTLSGASILDMGTGTGALAIKAARMGADNVTAVDINEQAVRNAELNVERCDLQSQIEVRLSDGFKCVDQHARFDLIVANLPGRSAKAIDAVEAAQWDTGFATHKHLYCEMWGAPQSGWANSHGESELSGIRPGRISG